MKSKGCSGWNRRNGDGMYILGMESSCDETSAAVVEMGGGTRRICSDIVASQIDVHRLYGGVVPEIASRAHIEAVSRITEEALRTAGVGLSDIGAIAVTTHPGLIGALLVGVNFAKSLAFANGIPLISVNHIHGHVAAAYLTEPTLKPPFLALVVSGGHTSLFHVRDYTDFSEIGATRDDAAGEAFDKIGRVIGMPYPGGAALDRLAYEGDPKAYDLPSPAIAGDTLDFSFSGLKTAALNIINSANQKGTPLNRADLAASYTEAVVHGIVKKTGMALTRLSGEVNTLVMAGGVAANSHLRTALDTLCRRRGIRFVVPERGLCGDNGAMIAAAFMRNIGEYSGGFTIYMGEINDIGGISLSLFLGIAMITLKLWQLADLALPLITLLAGQTILMFLFTYFVVFNIMGRDYDAAVLSSGVCGFGMGATPNAMANMQAICERYVPSVKAYLLVPLIGSLFADFLNSLVITFFINFL